MGDTKYKVGDMVVLKSGGPKMTISEVSTTGMLSYVCVWFDGEEEYRRADFYEPLLYKVNADNVYD